jgi:3-hydroxyisobutyrate dehydrogenase/putative dehydrogenase
VHVTDDQRNNTINKTAVGWIGLGAMGRPMAEVLLRDPEIALNCFDVVGSRLAKLESDGAHAAVSPAEVAARSSTVFVMVATPGQLEEVLFGVNGIHETVRPGSTVVITATVGPDSAESAARRLAAVGVDVVDAPVSGGVRRATDGDLLIIASGPPGARARTATLLDALGRDVFVFGDRVGDAQRVKLVNQLLCGAHIVVAAEALAFAEALGLEPEACWQAVRTGAGASFMLDDRGQRMLNPSDAVFSALSIFAKDMGLVSDAAAGAGYQPELALTTRALFDEAAHAGFAMRDDSTIIEFLRSTRRQWSA